MPISLICGACEAKLTAPDAAAGKKVKCRQCGVILEIPLPEPEPDFEVVEDKPAVKPATPKPTVKAPAPVPSSQTKAKPKPAMLEVADDDEDEPLPVKPKKKSKPVIVVDDEDDEDFKPTKKTGKKAIILAEDEDEDFDDEPKPKKGKKGKAKSKKASNSKLPLLIGGGVLGLALVGFLVYWFAIRTPDVATGPTPNPNPNGKPGPNGPQNPTTPPAGWEVVEKPDFSAWMLAGKLEEPPIPAPPTLASMKAYAKMQTNPEGAQFVMVMKLKPADAAAARTNPRSVVDKVLSSGGMSKGQLIARKETTVGGKPGESLHYRERNDDIYMQTAVDGDRVFLIFAGGDGLNDQSDRVKLFFDNFKILAGGSAKPGTLPSPNPPTGLGQLASADLSQYGMAVMLDLPENAKIRKDISKNGTISVNISIDVKLKEAAPPARFRVELTETLPQPGDKNWLNVTQSGWKTKESVDGGFFWERQLPEVGGGKAYGGARELKVAGKKVWISFYEIGIPDTQALELWTLMKTAKAN